MIAVRRHVVIGSTCDPGADSLRARGSRSVESRLADRLTRMEKPRRLRGRRRAVDVRGTPYQVERERDTWILRNQETGFAMHYLYPHQAANQIMDVYRERQPATPERRFFPDATGDSPPQSWRAEWGRPN